jgi:16S rRNA (adenine1518-N6/adenine1519-N6)-dimethyltransferase
MSERVRAKKSLGQNFLTDPNIQRRIVAALDPHQEDTVVEIGPGTGALTRHILGSVKRLIAVELDDALAARLHTELGDRSDFQLVHEDALALDFSTLDLPADYKAIGNIPYNITTPLLFKLLARAHRPRVIVVMVQKEVAHRITATPGNKDYGALSVGVQTIARAERLFTVARGSFRPVPGVDSAIVRITPIEPAPLSAGEELDVRELTRATFSHRRKQLQKSLRTTAPYTLTPEQIATLEKETGLTLEARPETLSAAQFVALARALRALGLPQPLAA